MKQKLVRKLSSARFDAVPETTASPADLEAINRLIPAGYARATAEDVHVRSALVCNDQVDHYSTRFTVEALGQIVALINGDPNGVNLMRNHNEYGSDDLPIGRLFRAELVQMDGVTHVRAWFYWERGTEDGDEMARKIALGIWREVSISWWMSSFTNSVDGKPFEESPYYPGQELPGGTIVVGIMSGIEEINEVSIVARGGQKDTSIQPARERGAVADVDGMVLAARMRGTSRTVSEPSVFDTFRARTRSGGLDHLFSTRGSEPVDWFGEMYGSG